MERKLFGTDGIRGRANKFPLTVDMISKIGMAIGAVLKKEGHRNNIVIGKDTRLSGYMIEDALAAGLNAVGIDVLLLGPIPTPGVAMLTKTMKCDIGIVISASHNPFYDNGIKLFDTNGVKFPDDIEKKIEDCLESNCFENFMAEDDKLGKRTVSEHSLYQQRYIQFLKNAFPRELSLDGLKIALDCANGASYKITPTVLEELGAELFVIGNQPNGININAECGSTDIKKLQKLVIEKQCDIGIALDGDADRIIIVDEKGREIDGDKIIALVAKKMIDEKTLVGDTVVVTQMSNLGLENYLKSFGLNVIRTKVGDRYVAEEMRKGGFNLGGEQSGHIILGDYSTTGDGTLVALQVLSILASQRNKKISEITNLYNSVPQLMENVVYDKDKSNPLEEQSVKNIIAKSEEKLHNNGRLLIRKSGTQPMIRVMVESIDSDLMKNIVKNIVEEIKKYV
ncbi:MAG TPA: phosphoglucosamine mutase [Rickettsiales bacterium]|nr:phosphoglucosamine mutase [Rickettsiales bacterium]